MPTFKYQAINNQGKNVNGEMEADDRKELMRKLKTLALSPLEIREKSETRPGGLAMGRRHFGGNRVSRKNITQFTAQLSALVTAKMNLAKALAALERQSVNSGMNAIIKSLLEDVQKGKNLSEGLEAYPKHFPALYVNMIKIGEVGGILDQALQRLVEMRLKDEELIGKVKGALAYPCIMALVMLGSIIVMLTFVIPRFSGIFNQMGAGLPLPTKIVIGSSNFLASWWWLLLIIAAALTVTGFQMLRQEKYRLLFDRFKLSLPVLGGIIHGICVSRYSLSLGALLSSGVCMMKALDATTPVTGNCFIEKTLRQISQEVREGGALSEALRRRTSVFPVLMVGMVGTGEEAGNLAEMLGNIGEYYRKDSEDKINTLTTLFEPAMIVVMGGVAGFIISAILLPIFNASTSIH